jgi:hypothetical protein
MTHRKSPSRQGREGITLLVVPPCFDQFSEKSTLIRRCNGRSRGNCTVQTPRRLSVYLLRGKLAAYMVFPLSRSTHLLLLLIVPYTVLCVSYSLEGKQQDVKCTCIRYAFLVDDKVNNLSATISPRKLKGFNRGIVLVSTVI